MKELVNLRKLAKLKIIKLVEPSKNLKESYAQKSEDSLLSSKFLLEKKQYNDSISLSYFSMYNSLLSLLFFCGIKSENHNASIFLLKEIFEIDNLEILYAKKERKDKQYYPSFSTSEKETITAIRITEQFNSEIREFIERLNSEKIKIIRIKFKKLNY
jgi:uncharacterized protein (UPF0332 family)